MTKLAIVIDCIADQDSNDEHMMRKLKNNEMITHKDIKMKDSVYYDYKKRRLFNMKMKSAQK